MTWLRSFAATVAVAAVLGAALPAAGKDFSLAAASPGDWAKYLVSTDNKTVAMMSQKDQARWRIMRVKVGTDRRIRMDTIIEMTPGRKTTPLGSVIQLDKPYDPLFLGGEAGFQTISTSNEVVTVKGKSYACTKIVRKLDRPEKLDMGQTAWRGTSTVWLSGEVPLGLVKMVNDYEETMGQPMKVVQTWLLDDSGFRNWTGN